jgi:hypothetical protein
MTILLDASDMVEAMNKIAATKMAKSFQHIISHSSIRKMLEKMI